jgi:hypothetical protein
MRTPTCQTERFTTRRRGGPTRNASTRSLDCGRMEKLTSKQLDCVSACMLDARGRVLPSKMVADIDPADVAVFTMTHFRGQRL